MFRTESAEFSSERSTVVREYRQRYHRFSSYISHNYNKYLLIMATSNCDDCTLLQYIPYWLLHNSWHWILIIVYFNWWKTSMDPNTRQSHPESGPRGGNTIHWLEKRGYLHSQTDARRLFIFHLVLLALEPIEGYWILTGWYRLFLPGFRMEFPNGVNWEGHFAKYLHGCFGGWNCWVCVGWGDVSLVYFGSSWWVMGLEPKGESDAGKWWWPGPGSITLD